jgi:hypothetical protein
MYLVFILISSSLFAFIKIGSPGSPENNPQNNSSEVIGFFLST